MDFKYLGLFFILIEKYKKKTVLVNLTITQIKTQTMT